MDSSVAQRIARELNFCEKIFVVSAGDLRLIEFKRFLGCRRISTAED